MTNNLSYRIDNLYKKVGVVPNQHRVNKTLNTGTMRNKLANTLNIPKNENRIRTNSFSNKNAYTKFF